MALLNVEKRNTSSPMTIDSIEGGQVAGEREEAQFHIPAFDVSNIYHLFSGQLEECQAVFRPHLQPHFEQVELSWLKCSQAKQRFIRLSLSSGVTCFIPVPT